MNEYKDILEVTTYYCLIIICIGYINPVFWIKLMVEISFTSIYFLALWVVYVEFGEKVGK